MNKGYAVILAGYVSWGLFPLYWALLSHVPSLEVLLHRKHGRNLELFEEAGAEIKGWVKERLLDAEQLGLPYPYDAMTLVEVPNPLRSYGGGWQMDTVQAPPGMLMLKETGYPTALTSRSPIEVIERRTDGLHHGLMRCRTAGIDFVVAHLVPHAGAVRAVPRR